MRKDARKEILPGGVFGRLRIIEKIKSSKKISENTWLCECKCGDIKEYRTNYIYYTQKELGVCCKDKLKKPKEKYIAGSKIIGSKYGRFTVLEFYKGDINKNRVKVQCKCGETKEVGISALYSVTEHGTCCYAKDKSLIPTPTSVKDLTGQIIGRFTILDKAGLDKHNNREWIVQCKCGNIKTMTTARLNNSSNNGHCCPRKKMPKKKSIKKIPTLKERTWVLLSGKYQEKKKRHKAKNMSGVIMTREEYTKMALNECYYCGLEHSLVIEDRISEHIIKYNGIDRLDSDIGYTKDNSVACCYYCNRAKNTMTEKEFYEWVNKISCNLKQKGKI